MNQITIETNKEMKKSKPYENIKTFEDALEIAGSHFEINTLPHLASVFSENISNGIIALMKLQIITWAINNDDSKAPEWIPDYMNPNQNKWSTVYRMVDKQFLPFQTQNAWIYPSVGGGERLVFKDEARAFHADKFFRDIYKALYTI